MAHTPGPWTLHVHKKRENIWGTPIWDGQMPEVEGSDGHVIADIRWNGKNEGERGKANAYLIAASPDLRRFAQEIAALEPQDFDPHMGEALIRRARALVVKADGAT